MYFMILCVVSFRPHPRPSSQSVSLLSLFSFILAFFASIRPFRAIPFLFTLLRPLWHTPKLTSFLFNGFRPLCPETAGGGVPPRSLRPGRAADGLDRGASAPCETMPCASLKQ